MLHLSNTGEKWECNRTLHQVSKRLNESKQFSYEGRKVWEISRHFLQEFWWGDYFIQYNAEWKFVVYVPLAPILEQITTTEQYVAHINQLWSKIDIKNRTTCNHFDGLISSWLGQVRHTEKLITNTVGPNSYKGRVKWGVLNFVDKISKILFGSWRCKLFVTSKETASSLKLTSIWSIRSYMGIN